MRGQQNLKYKKSFLILSSDFISGVILAGFNLKKKASLMQVAL
jgi:hypothetical protein